MKLVTGFEHHVLPPHPCSRPPQASRSWRAIRNQSVRSRARPSPVCPWPRRRRQFWRRRLTPMHYRKLRLWLAPHARSSRSTPMWTMPINWPMHSPTALRTTRSTMTESSPTSGVPTGGEYRVVEETPDGEREYFYRGDSDYPFLVCDNRYSYAYDGGELVEVYDSYGRPLSQLRRRRVRTRRTLPVPRSPSLRCGRARTAAVSLRQRLASPPRRGLCWRQQQWAVEQQRNPDWRRVHDERRPAPATATSCSAARTHTSCVRPMRLTQPR